MQTLALALITVVNGETRRLMNSALPDSPIVPVPPPSPRRQAAASLLRRLADRLAEPPRPMPAGVLSAPSPR